MKITTNTEWNDNGELTPPRPLLTEIAEPNEYPIHVLPELMRDAAIAISEHVMAPTALAGQCVIGACTHLAQSRVNAYHMHKQDGMPCSLMLLTLGLSGDRKTACRNLAFREIDLAEMASRNRHKAQTQLIQGHAKILKGKAHEDFIAANPMPLDPATQYSDATFERIAGDFIRGKSYATWDTDEAGQMLAGSSIKAETRSATIGGLCKVFDDGKVERSRSLSNADGSGIAYHRRMSIRLMGQPVAVAAALADPLLRGQGFLPRFLFSAPVSLAGSRFITAEALKRKSYEDERLKKFWSRCQEIMSTPEHINELGEITPPTLTWDVDAQNAWLLAYNAIESELGPLGRYASIQPFAGRFGELAVRVATVFAFFDDRSTVDLDCMERACELVLYSLNEWLRYTEANTIDPALKEAAEAMLWLRDPRRAKRWRLFHVDQWGKSGPAQLRSAKKRDHILSILVSHGHLLTRDGKEFRVYPLADSEDHAESQ